MKIWRVANRALARRLIPDFEKTADRKVRNRYGLVAAWISALTTLILFGIKMTLGLMSGSVSVVADAFHVLSHLANSVILIVSFWVASKPSTPRTPFGHGRMEHVAPLIMSVFLFVSGIEIGERSIHQAVQPRPVHYWPSLPWILLATVLVKEWVGGFVRYLGERVDSNAIRANALHQRIESVSSLTVIAGLVAGHFLGIPEVDGYIGVLVSGWILYLGYTHGREAVIPLLGKAPSRALVASVRDTAKSVDGIEDVHEIIIHDYGSMYLISLHGEIPEEYGPARMHDIAERCEGTLRETFGGEVVCHTDPVLRKTEEILAVERKFAEAVAQDPRISDYHDFRVAAESPERIIIVADLDVVEEVPETEFGSIASALEARAKRSIENLAYCTFYVTPKFAY
ncbi:MAG: cation transporter [Deltaproteobacteria bacterium]|nr:cation transporter [Deltaproteobacteria bacterium]MBW2121679.1 cation transporter [Deltaproteobacteria bacterium]